MTGLYLEGTLSTCGNRAMVPGDNSQKAMP
jgi:hypothetical protein